MQEADQEELRQRHGQEISSRALHLYILSEGVEQEHFQGAQRSSLLSAMLHQTVWLARRGKRAKFEGLMYSLSIAY